ncbi:MAG: FecR domain-containing protein [Desulfobacterales bacterium]|nr:FecR domain-containing protein [Desulfobacterales bacterium]
MKPFNNKTIFCLLLLLVLGLCLDRAISQSAALKTADPKIDITFLVGNAYCIKKGKPEIKPLSPGETLSWGEKVITPKSSRIELEFPEKNYIRLDEHTTFQLLPIVSGEQTIPRYSNLNLVQGKIWINVSKIAGHQLDLKISNITAISVLQSSVCRVNVNPDNSVILKVYRGEVIVGGSDESDAYIARSMQQIIVWQNGGITKPFRFTAKADSNPWVRWNRQKDIEKTK